MISKFSVLYVGQIELDNVAELEPLGVARQPRASSSAGIPG